MKKKGKTRKDGSLFDSRTKVSARETSNPKKRTVMPISETSARKEADEVLRQSEEKFRTLYEKSVRAEEIYRSLLNSCADAIVIYDMEGRATYVSDSFTRIFGWTLDELYGKRIPYVPDSERELTTKQVEAVTVHGIAGSGFETKRFTKDGRILHTRISASRFNDHDGKPAGMLAILSDITKNKIAEEALAQSEKQMRLLSAQLLAAQENERKRVAQELHDGIGQSLTAIKFRLENALKQPDKGISAVHGESIQAIIPVIQDAIEEVRRISMDLRPSILDDLGIVATISWFCREFQTTYPGITVDKQIELTEDGIPDVLKIVIFRLVQEALNNVAKHSKADRVQIRLGNWSGAIELEIRDNGVGFDWKTALESTGFRKGFGLASMRERTESLGGSFSIDTWSGGWTGVRATWHIDRLRTIRK